MSKTGVEEPEKRSFATRSRSSSLAGSGVGSLSKAPVELRVEEKRPRVQEIFPGEEQKEQTMFALSKTMAEEESGSEEESSRSGTSTEGEGEPIISLHLSSAVREALLQEHHEQEQKESQHETKDTKESKESKERKESKESKEKQVQVELPASEEGFDWRRFDGVSVAEVAAEFALHVARWGALPARALPSWPLARAAWLLPAARAPPAPTPAAAPTTTTTTTTTATTATTAASTSTTTSATTTTTTSATSSDVAPSLVAEEEETRAPPASVLPPVGAVPAALVPELDLDAEVDYATLPVLPELPLEAPSLQQTRQYKNYMRLRYEVQRRNPGLELPKPISGWYKDGKPSSADPAVKEATDKASEKLRAAMEQLKAAKEGALPVVKVTHRMSMASDSPVNSPKAGRKDTLSRASDTPTTAEDKKDRRFSAAAKPSKRMSVGSVAKKKPGDSDLPDELQL